MLEYNNLIEDAAKHLGAPPEEVKAEIQKAIDAAWNNPSPEARAKQDALFGKGKKPTPEELIAVLAGSIADKAD